MNWGARFRDCEVRNLSQARAAATCCNTCSVVLPRMKPCIRGHKGVQPDMRAHVSFQSIASCGRRAAMSGGIAISAKSCPCTSGCRGCILRSTPGTSVRGARDANTQDSLGLRWENVSVMESEHHHHHHHCHLHQPRHHRSNITRPKARGCQTRPQPIHILPRHWSGGGSLEPVEHEEHVKCEQRFHHVRVRPETGVLSWFSPARLLWTNFRATLRCSEGGCRRGQGNDTANQPLQPSKQAAKAHQKRQVQ